MPSWKKVITSGSSAHLNEITGSGGVHLPDSAKLTLGDAQDLKIYHGGSNSIIQEGGAGGLIIRASTLTLLADNTSENFVICTENAGVDLYYNGLKKLETVSGGVTVTGTLAATTLTGAHANADSAVQPADTFYIGTTSVAHNRGSGGLTLAGITLTTPDIGTPSAGTLTNCSGLPAANISQGTMASGMVLVAPALGTPASGDLSSCTFPTLNQSTSGTAAIATTATVADTTDTTCYVGLWESATGNLGAKSDAGLTYNAGTGMLTATGLTGPLTGNASTATKISSITNSNIVQLTSSQTLTNKTLTSPDINGGTWNGTVDGNSTAAGITWADLGSVTTIDINGGTINGCTITGNVSGQAGTVATITGLAPDTATTQATQAAITSAANLATVGTIGTGVWNGDKVASAYLDDDTAHLTTTQTFSGDKSFSAAVNIDATTAASSKTTGALIVDGGVGVNLDIHAGGDVVAYATSDKRLKDNLQVIQDPLDKVGQISGYEFDWNEESPEWAQERGHDIGVVAQEVQKVLPEIISERTNGYLGVDYERLIPLLIESIKELKQEVEDLKKKVN
jgi:hypothetical protein